MRLPALPRTLLVMGAALVLAACARDAAPPEGTARLRHATIVLPDAAARDELLGRLEVEETAEGPLVRDPSGNALLLASG